MLVQGAFLCHAVDAVGVDAMLLKKAAPKLYTMETILDTMQYISPDSLQAVLLKIVKEGQKVDFEKEMVERDEDGTVGFLDIIYTAMTLLDVFSEATDELLSLHVQQGESEEPDKIPAYFMFTRGACCSVQYGILACQ